MVSCLGHKYNKNSSTDLNIVQQIAMKSRH